MKKKKTIKSDSWQMDIVYTKQVTRDLIRQLNQEIESQNNWIELLQKKKSLEEQLSAVRVLIIKRCIISSCQQRNRCKTRLAKLQEPPKKKKKKVRK